MSKARDLGDLLDTDGDVVSGSLDNAPTPSKTSIEALGIDLPAANLTGSIANARIPAGALNSNAITKSTSEPTISTNPSGGVGTTWLRTTTGEMYCCTDATAGANVWTNVGAGSGDVAPWTGTAATGGNVTTDGDYKVHIFNSSGTFTVTTPGTDGVVEALVIAGGGGAGGHAWGAGGGGGGWSEHTGYTKSVSAQAYSVVVGAGGSGGSANVAVNTGSAAYSGNNSSALGLIGNGGGAGGSTTTGRDPANGGSGGGSGSHTTSGGSATQGSGGTAHYGNAGGAGDNQNGHGGGGGGAGGTGGNAGYAASSGGSAGASRSNSITGGSVSYAGGGAGATGGGGAAGSANTGDGGNAGDRHPTAGGNGGSGVVIIRYKFQ